MNFKELQNKFPADQVRQILFVGLGNPLRTDDYVGIEFVNRLQQTCYFCQSQFLVAGTNPENYLGKILNSDCSIIVFVDAADAGRIPGDVFWIHKNDIAEYDFSTHAFSISLLDEYLRKSKEIQVLYLGIQKASSENGSGLSDAVSKMIENYFNKNE